jgi:hypothetical protein
MLFKDNIFWNLDICKFFKKLSLNGNVLDFATLNSSKMQKEIGLCTLLLCLARVNQHIMDDMSIRNTFPLGGNSQANTIVNFLYNNSLDRTNSVTICMHLLI